MTIPLVTLDRAAIKIQTAYRGHLGRKAFGRIYVSYLQKELKGEGAKLLKQLIHVAARVEESYKHQLIHQEREVEALEMIKRLRTSLKIFNERTGKMSFKSPFSLKSHREEGKELRQELKFHRELLRDICTKSGFYSVNEGMEILFGARWKDQFNQQSIDEIEQFSQVFQPLCYQFVEASNVENSGICILESSDPEKRIPADSELILSGRPWVTEMRFSNEETLTEKLHGAELNIGFKDGKGNYRLLVMTGLFGTDPIGAQKEIEIVKEKVKSLENEIERLPHIPKGFKEIYIEQFPLRDLFTQSSKEIVDELEEDYAYLQRLGEQLSPTEVVKFAISPVSRQIKLMSLMLMKDDTHLAVFIYDLTAKQIPEYQQLLRNTLPFTLQKKLNLAIDDLKTTLANLKKLKAEDASYESKIAASKMPEVAKLKAIEKVKQIKAHSSEADKAEKYMQGLCKIPFEKYTENKVTMESPSEEIRQYLLDVKATLNLATHGQQEPKHEILKWVAQRISNSSSLGEVFAFEGPPGVGKTTLARFGIAKSLDRPFAFISMGGQSKACYLIGHGFTYVGSEWGRIIDILIQSKCMDPVIYIDEIDKISQTEEGRELIGVLTALTDPSQNKEFHDRYFSGIDFDLSRALLIFSYNDVRMLDPVFKDRLHIIKIQELKLNDKLQVAQKHLMPEILNLTGFKPGQITIEDDVVAWVVDNYTKEPGVRDLRKNLLSIVRELNLDRLMEPGSIQYPYKIDQETVIRIRKSPTKDYNLLYI